MVSVWGIYRVNRDSDLMLAIRDINYIYQPYKFYLPLLLLLLLLLELPPPIPRPPFLPLLPPPAL